MMELVREEPDSPAWVGAAAGSEQTRSRATALISIITHWLREGGLAARKLKTGALLLLGAVAILAALFFSLRNIVLLRLVEHRIEAYQSRSGQSRLRVGSVLCG